MASRFARPIAVSVVLIALVAIGAISVMAEEPAVPVAAAASFSGARAMAHLEAIVAIGPRVSGSEGMRQRDGARGPKPEAPDLCVPASGCPA